MIKHGTNAGYQAGCRDDCCLDPHFRWTKQWKMRRLAGEHTGLVSSEPSRRKVRALARMGWSLAVVAGEIGVVRQALHRNLERDLIQQSTHRDIDAAYRKLEMLVPPDTGPVRQTKNWAARHGWPPPLAWEDIDAGILAAAEKDTERKADRLDEALVQRIYNNPVPGVKLSKAEKTEVMRRWLASGRSETDLCRLTGWKEGRYGKQSNREEAPS